MKRGTLALLLTVCAQAAPSQLSQCVEFPYPGMPRQLWDRELVWMKNIGVDCVAVPDAPELSTILSTLRKLDVPAWIVADKATSVLRSTLDPFTEAHGGPVRWIGQEAAPQPVYRVSAIDPQALALTRGYLRSKVAPFYGLM